MKPMLGAAALVAGLVLVLALLATRGRTPGAVADPTRGSGSSSQSDALEAGTDESSATRAAVGADDTDIVTSSPAAGSAVDDPREPPGSRPFTGALVVRIVFPLGAPARGASAELFGPSASGVDASFAAWEAYQRPSASQRHLLHGGAGSGREEPVLRLVADDAGRVHLPLPFAGSSLRASAERGGVLHRGVLDFQTSRELRAGGEMELVVEPVRIARVRVLDDAGEPVADVPLALVRRRASGNGFVPRAHYAGRTDEHGRAQLVVGGDGSSEPPSHVRALVVADPPVEVGLPWEQEAVLRLPPMGEVVLEVPQSVGWAAAAELVVANAAYQVPTWSRLVDGAARFPHVAVGLTLDAELADPPSSMPRRFVGPEGPGVRVVERWDASFVGGIVSARLVDELGAPLVRRTVAIRGLAPGRARTDADGILLWAPSAVTVLPTELELVALDDALAGGKRRQRKGTATLPADGQGEKQGERRDLGTVVLAALPLIASGVVLDAAGAPIAGARVVAAAPDDDGVLWQRPERPGDVTDGEGRFAIFAEMPPGPLELRATAAGHATPQAVPIAAPAHGVRLVLRIGAGVELALRLPARMFPLAVAVRASRGEAPVEIPNARPQSMDDVGSGATRYQRDALESGEWAFEITDTLSGDVLWSHSAWLAAGAWTDLGVVDLVDAVPWIELTVLDELGVPLERAKLRRAGTHDEALVISPPVVLRQSEAEVEITANGCRPARVALRGEAVSVVLQSAAVVMLRLPAGCAAVEPGRRLRLWIRRSEGPTDALAAPLPEDDGRSFRLALGAPGRLTATLCDAQFRPLVSCDFELPAALAEAGGALDLPFDAGEWGAALSGL